VAVPFPDVSQIAIILSGYVSVQRNLGAVAVEFIVRVRGRWIFDDKSHVHADGEPGVPPRHPIRMPPVSRGIAAQAALRIVSATSANRVMHARSVIVWPWWILMRLAGTVERSA
jgi:hypothetical protein